MSSERYAWSDLAHIVYADRIQEEAQKADQDLKAAAATDTEHNKRELELNRLIEECGRKIKEVQHVVDRLKAKAEGYQKEA